MNVIGIRSSLLRRLPHRDAFGKTAPSLNQAVKTAPTKGLFLFSIMLPIAIGRMVDYEFWV